MAAGRRKRYKWYGRKMRRAESKAVDVAGNYLQAKVQLALMKPAGARSIRVTRQTTHGNKTSRTVYKNPSKPGQAPHLRTGNLRNNIFHDHFRNARRPVSRVGWRANAIYGFYHEMGIRYSRAGMQKRPHLIPTFKKERRAMGRLMRDTMRRVLR